MAIPRRRFLALSGGVAAAGGLSACGSSTGRPGPSAPPSASPSGDGGPPRLRQWYHQYAEEGVEDAVKRYAAGYDEAEVTVEWTPGEYEDLVSAALLGDDPPDVFEYVNGPTLEMIKAGHVLDLTDTLGGALAGFAQTVLAAMIWDGKVWAIPQTVDLQMLYYRRSMLEKAGLEPPQTMDELITAARALRSDAIGGFFAGNDGGVGVLGNQLIWAAGLEQINVERTGIGFATEAMYDGLLQFRDLHSDGLLLTASADWSDPAPFVNEETAMQWTGLSALPEIQDNFGDDLGVVPFPAIGPSGRQVVPFRAFSSCVAAKGAYPDAAKAFVRWLWVDREDYQVDFSDSYGTRVPAKPALAERAGKLSEGAGAAAARFLPKLGHAPSLLWTPAIMQAYTAAVTNVVSQGADPQTEIAAVATIAKAELKRVNR